MFPDRSAIGASEASLPLPGKTMGSFRYRTATLLGPWRDSAEAAVRDAIRAKQGRRDEDGIGWHWLVPGVIEEGHGLATPERGIGRRARSAPEPAANPGYPRRAGRSPLKRVGRP
jgi:hypothetical protein